MLESVQVLVFLSFTGILLCNKGGTIDKAVRLTQALTRFNFKLFFKFILPSEENSKASFRQYGVLPLTWRI